MSNSEINIEKMMKYMSDLDCLDLDEGNFLFCKFDNLNNLPLVVFDKDEELYYFFETIGELEDQETGGVNLESMVYLYYQKEEKIVFIYQGKTYGATYGKFNYKTTKEYYSKKENIQLLFGRYLYQEGFFFFDHQRYTNKYGSEIFNGKYYDQLVKECKKYIETKINSNLKGLSDLEIAKGIFEYIHTNYKYAGYMLNQSNQKDFDTLACENPEAFFLPEILKNRECVCQSYSQLYLMLNLKFLSGNKDVHTIMVIPKNGWINHVRNIGKYNGKYYFIDLTIGLFKEISEKAYKKYFETELYSGKYTIENE